MHTNQIDTSLFPYRCKILYELVAPGVEVDIADIYCCVMGKDIDTMGDIDPRSMQQRIGTYITRLNRLIEMHKLAVRPGRLKRTYVLTKID